MAELKGKAGELFAETYDKHYKAMLKYALVRLHYAKESAEDCVQDAFVVYYKRLLSGESIINPRAFLYRAVENLCKRSDADFVREAKRRADLDELSETPAPENDRLASELDYDEIAKLLVSALTDSEQELFRLKYTEGKALSEIGVLLGISANAAALRVSRLRTKIKSLVEPIINEYRKGG